MRIAYYTHYIGPKMNQIHFKDQKFSLAAGIKSQGIARALLLAGHDVTIYSVAIPIGNKDIKAFTEVEVFPEGKLTIKYPDLHLYSKRGPLNELRLHKLMRKDHKENPYDIFVYYNIMYGSCMHLNLFKNAIRILEYEDNIFNKFLEGGKRKLTWLRKIENRYVLRNSDGAFAVSMGILNDQEIKDRVITPGVINDEVKESVSSRINTISKDKPVRLIIMGGTGWDKGTDVLFKAMCLVETPCILDIYSNISLYNSIQSLYDTMPERHKVEFKGFKPHRELIQILDREADILLCTTRNLGVRPQGAGFPSKMLDYSATGRPIVSSELAMLDDEFNQCVTYYESDSPESLAAKIEEVIANYDNKVQKALALQQIVLSQYTIEGTSMKLQSLIKKLVNKKR